MLRILFAALAGGIVLRVWAVVSAAVLPWPLIAVGPIAPPPAALTAQSPIGTSDSARASSTIEPSLRTASPAADEETPPLPSRGYYRSAAHPPAAVLPWRQVLAELSASLLAALMTLAIPPGTPWPRQAALLGLGAASAVLVCNFSQAARLDWTTDYAWVLCTDHFISIALVSIVVSVVVHARWPRRTQQSLRLCTTPTRSVSEALSAEA